MDDGPKAINRQGQGQLLERVQEKVHLCAPCRCCHHQTDLRYQSRLKCLKIVNLP